VPKTKKKEKVVGKLELMGKGSYLGGGNSNMFYFHPYLGE